VTGSLHRALGLTDEEAASITGILGRAPNSLELALYAVMWSEHCSYKSSRVHLGRLPTEAPWVLVGPGENAGVVDLGDGIAAALRIESHNHPSAIEPVQGAATGVGGILRDIFTMGARPMATLDSIHFGPLDDPVTGSRSRWLLEGVVDGISGYGNSVGVPTVGGEVAFGPGFAGNPLVNVMCVGLMPVSRLVLAQATEPGQWAVLLGSSTGRDGIGGVSVLASSSFEALGTVDEDKRPSVQVGDPFEEKRLIEACLALYDAGLVTGIQDLGGAGLACATSETASRGGTGMDVFLSEVPLREPGMTPPEVMTSESQERMLALVAPEDLDQVLAICRRWEVQATVIGTVTAGGRLRILAERDGDLLAELPASSLHDDAPRYRRPLRPPGDVEARRAVDPVRLPAPDDCGADLLELLGDTSWVWSQYDHQLFCNTIAGPGADAAVLRVKAPGLPASRRAMALTVDSNSRWCDLDPRQGTEMVVAEATLNLACVGARPLALVNCLNLGDPEHPEVMWQLSEVIDGLATACRALSLPVVGGNVSLYNASAGLDIDPTPVVGVLGLIEELDRRPPGRHKEAGEAQVMIGPDRAGTPSLGGSRWADAVHGHRGGRLPVLDLEAHASCCALVAELVRAGLVSGIHDVSDGGLALALAEMAVLSATGFSVDGVAAHTELFAEPPSHVVACIPKAALEGIESRARTAGMRMRRLGRAGGDRLVVEGLVDVSLQEATAAWRSNLRRHMEVVPG
jgi:phosphoribosylformylglycinamidine synthase II